MKRKSVVPGIDLAFRPSSYFWPLGLETHLLATIKGAERKALLKHLISAGRSDDIPDFLTRSALREEERQGIGRIHPALMGGEYLPDLEQAEVEIARITIASVTQDVTSVYARRDKKRIYYRVVDEYEGDTLTDKRTRTSTRPLTLGQLETFLNGAWSIFENLEMNFGDDGYVVQDMLGFEKVESEFYPDIRRLYDQRIEAWAADRRKERGLDQVTGVHNAGADESPANEAAPSQATTAPDATEMRTGVLSQTEGAAYSHGDSATVSFAYFRTPDGKPPHRRQTAECRRRSLASGCPIPKTRFELSTL